MYHLHYIQATNNFVLVSHLVQKVTRCEHAIHVDQLLKSKIQVENMITTQITWSSHTKHNFYRQNRITTYTILLQYSQYGFCTYTTWLMHNNKITTYRTDFYTQHAFALLHTQFNHFTQNLATSPLCLTNFFNIFIVCCPWYLTTISVHAGWECVILCGKNDEVTDRLLQQLLQHFLSWEE